MSPEAIREKNFLKKGDTTIGGMTIRNWTLPSIWSQLQASASWATRLAAVQTFNKNNRWIKRGIAMMPVRFGVAQSGANFDSIVNIYPDGTVSITHGGSEIGQGINTKVAQIVAYKLGLTKDQMNLVTVNESSTRCLSAATNVTGGSVTSELCGLSAMHACETLNSRLNPFRQKGLSWQQVIANASTAGVELTATGWTNAPPPGSGIFNYNSLSAAVTEVELDALTGQFELKQVDIVFDCGISLNPTIDIGQVEGAFAMGQGYYTQESINWDEKTGKSMDATTWEYKPVSAYDIPEKLNVTLLKNAPNPLGVLSSKASGEPAVALGSSVVKALECAVSSVRSDNNIDKKLWVGMKVPLTVDTLMLACGTTIKNLTI